MEPATVMYRQLQLCLSYRSSIQCIRLCCTVPLVWDGVVFHHNDAHMCVLMCLLWQWSVLVTGKIFSESHGTLPVVMETGWQCIGMLAEGSLPGWVNNGCLPFRYLVLYGFMDFWYCIVPWIGGIKSSLLKPKPKGRWRAWHPFASSPHN